VLTDWELPFINTFVKPDLRERWLFMHSSEKRRRKLLVRLHHHFDFQAREISKLACRNTEEMAKLLKKKSGTTSCYVVSTAPNLDGKIVTFQHLLSYEVGWPDSSVYVFDRTRLALFCDEYDSYLLAN
jgi:hypothetical protein